MKAYIAKDKNGDIFLYMATPKKWENYWFSASSSLMRLYEEYLPEGVNPQWEDEEPIEVELKIEKI